MSIRKPKENVPLWQNCNESQNNILYKKKCIYAGCPNYFIVGFKHDSAANVFCLEHRNHKYILKKRELRK